MVALPLLDQLGSFGQQAHDALLSVLVGQDRPCTPSPLPGRRALLGVMEEV